MKYPDHEFDRLLSEASIERSSRIEYLRIGREKLPAALIEGNIPVVARIMNYSTWGFWIESFDNTQRAAVRGKLIALRVQARLEGS